MERYCQFELPGPGNATEELCHVAAVRHFIVFRSGIRLLSKTLQTRQVILFEKICNIAKVASRRLCVKHSLCEIFGKLGALVGRGRKYFPRGIQRAEADANVYSYALIALSLLCERQRIWACMSAGCRILLCSVFCIPFSVPSHGWVVCVCPRFLRKFAFYGLTLNQNASLIALTLLRNKS